METNTITIWLTYKKFSKPNEHNIPIQITFTGTYTKTKRLLNRR